MREGVLIVVGLVVGVALGFGLAQLCVPVPGVQPYGSTPEKEPDPLPGPPPVLQPEPGTEEQEPLIVEPPPARERLVTRDDDAAALLDAAPPSSPARGPGKITVQVATPAGRPVEGVEVRATPERETPPAPRSRSTDEPESDAERLRQYAERLQHDRQSTVTATTGPDGTCVLSGLAEVKHSLRARAPGYELDRKGRGGRVTPDAQVEYEARPLVLQRLDVQLPEGGHPEEAQIRLRYESHGTGFRWRPEDPEFEMRADEEVEITATVSGERELRSEPCKAQAAAGSSPAPLVLQLQGRNGIRGTVVGLPTEGWFRVQAVPAAEGTGPDLRRPRGRPDHSDSVNAGGDGSFQLLDLEPGSYRVVLSKDRRTEIASAEVLVSDGIATCELHCQPPEERPRDSYAIVWVRTPDGQPAEHVRFSLRLRMGSGSHGWGAGQERLEDGSYLIEPLEPDRELIRTGPVEYFLEVRARGYGPREVAFQRTAATVIEVLLEEPATLQVVVPGMRGSEHANALEVSAYVERESGRDGVGSAKLIEADIFELKELAPIEIVVELRLATDRWRGAMIGKRTVQLRPGMNRVQLPLPALHRLEVVAPNLAPGTHVNVRNEELGDRFSNQGQTQVDTEHHALFEHLPAGKYRVWADGREMTVVVSGSTTVVWQPDAEDALRVYVQEPDGYLARAGFQSGDLIVGVDGKRPGSAQELHAALIQIAAALEEARVAVLRDGVPLTLTVDALRFTTRNDLGGHWRPTPAGNR